MMHVHVVENQIIMHILIVQKTVSYYCWNTTNSIESHRIQKQTNTYFITNAIFVPRNLSQLNICLWVQFRAFFVILLSCYCHLYIKFSLCEVIFVYTREKFEIANILIFLEKQCIFYKSRKSFDIKICELMKSISANYVIERKSYVHVIKDRSNDLITTCR